MDKKEQYRYIQEYKRKNYARTLLELRPEEKARWKEAAAAQGMSLQSFVKTAVTSYIAACTDKKHIRREK